MKPIFFQLVGQGNEHKKESTQYRHCMEKPVAIVCIAPVVVRTSIYGVASILKRSAVDSVGARRKRMLYVLEHWPALSHKSLNNSFIPTYP